MPDRHIVPAAGQRSGPQPGREPYLVADVVQPML